MIWESREQVHLNELGLVEGQERKKVNMKCLEAIQIMGDVVSNKFSNQFTQRVKGNEEYLHEEGDGL